MIISITGVMVMLNLTLQHHSSAHSFCEYYVWLFVPFEPIFYLACTLFDLYDTYYLELLYDV